MSKQKVDAKQTAEKSDRAQKKSESVDAAIKIFEVNLAKGAVKMTTTEYLRLLELQDQNELREIKITWVEPAKMEFSNKE